MQFRFKSSRGVDLGGTHTHRLARALYHLVRWRWAPLAQLVLWITLVVGATVAEAGTVYVSPAGTDSMSCGAQASPCRSPDQGVKRASSGDTIIVAGGTYVAPGPSNACSNLTTIKSVVCVVDKSLAIQGGYAAGTWAFDPAANLTVIDGQNINRGVHVFSSVAGKQLTMSNIVIQNGRAQGTDAFGGGMIVDNVAVTLDGVKFVNNQVLGADLTGAIGGAAAGSGLSIRSALGPTASLLRNVAFQGNRSVGGHGSQRGGYAFGALFIHGTTVDIESSSFSTNTAEGGASTGEGQLGGARADALGGAISVGGGGSVSLFQVTATANQVLGGAGAQYGGGGFGGALFAENATAEITDSVFQANLAQGAASASGGMGVGGAIVLFNSNGAVSRAHIIANRARGGDSSGAGQPSGSGGAGGLSLWRIDPNAAIPPIAVDNTVIADNVVERGQGVNAGGGGGGLAVQGVSANLKHVTLARNQLGAGLTAGQAMLLITSPGLPGTGLDVRYSVIADHVATTPGAAAVVIGTNNTLSLTQGAFWGNTKNTNADGAPLSPGSIQGLTSMIAAAPGFVAPGPPSYDYHITATSALRDAATGSTMLDDMDGQLRPHGATPDIGADEYEANAFDYVANAFDMDGDGKADILWRHTSGAVAIWLMNGTSIASMGAPVGVGTEWTIQGAGDFDGDSKADILWRHTSGAVAIWVMNGTNVASMGAPVGVGTEWTIQGAGDFNGDGKADIVWRHPSGAVAIWLMNGTNVASMGAPVGVGTEWTIHGVGDFNDDGRADILWRHTSGAVAIWLMNGTNVASMGAPLDAGTDWTIQGVGDFNGDGKADVLWRHSSGSIAIWLMNGTSVISAGPPTTVGLDWTIQ